MHFVITANDNVPAPGTAEVGLIRKISVSVGSKIRHRPNQELSAKSGVNVIKVLHLYFTRVAIVSLAENNSCTCKLQV